MSNCTTRTRRRKSLLTIAALTAASVVTLAGCSSGGGSGGSDEVGVALITKTTTNPYYVAMNNAAKSVAKKDGVHLTLAAGTKDGDASAQITAVQNSVSRGDKGILITPIDSSVNHAIEAARKAGLIVIALDSPPDPINTVDVTYATDNRAAGVAIGKWAAAQLNGKKATIALIDSLKEENDSVDINRDQGFLKGMGIPLNNPNKNLDEAKTGSYKGGSGGQYEIVGNQFSNGDQGDGRTAMEILLSKNSDINVVYAINEPAATGAYQALKAAGKTKDTILVAIDGGCTGVKEVSDGIIGATSQQYPSKMAKLGMAAVVKFAKTGKKPKVSAGLDFHNTGSNLVTDKAVSGLKSIDTAAGAKMCWGK